MAWRLLLHPPASTQCDAAWNMAVDEALLDSFLAGTTPPTLRLYGWNPPAVSLGRFQSLPDNSPLLRAGLPLVRRLSGGRAVLHDRELTYSVVMGQNGQGVAESYRAISEGLRRGLVRLGVETDYGKKPAREGALETGCYAAATRSDLVVLPAPVADRLPYKLVGSAQCRRGTALLQHGSIPLCWNEPLYRSLFGAAPSEEGAGSLADALGRVPSWEELANAILAGFRDLWGQETDWSDLTPAETERARILARDR